MRKFVRALTICLVVTAAATSISSAQDTRMRIPDEGTLEPLGMVRRWYIQLPLQGAKEKIIGLKTHENLLFAQTNDGVLHCMDTESGHRKWSATISTVGSDVFPPAPTAEAVYVTSGKILRKLNRETGRLVFEKELPTAASAGAVANEHYIYVPLGNHYVEALAIDPPDRRFKTHLPVAWHYNAIAPINNPPVLLSDRVAIAGADGNVFVSNLKKREMIFQFLAQSEVAAPLAAHPA